MNTMKFNVGDFIKEGESVGFIISEYYRSNEFDWEVAFPKGNSCGCLVDCCNSKDLKHYDWKKYPKTVQERINTLFERR